ncbi:hypothetical protein N4T20_10150 [Flavobacterium sp. TR2]|uniref:hypothetical protein n=1 Tax=Flavobacterium sp. TR2 TaxID=2977321 RepID=UPI0021B120F5|nr:hypothetical protein [Flavobacterium sp. TR2]UWY30281.1 hypothetical protein N4T20_10150 [Flavobacterium sp. TR2]
MFAIKFPFFCRDALQCVLCSTYIRAVFEIRFFQELFPAMRCNLFGPNPGPKRISAPIGAKNAVSGEAFGEMEDFEIMKKLLKKAPNAENPIKTDAGKYGKIRKCQPFQEKPYAL